MIGNNILTLVMGVLLSGVVLGQQPHGSVLGQQTGPTTQQQRPLQPQRPPLSALQPRPSIANVGLEQLQAFNTLNQQLQGVPASRFTPAQPQGPQAFNTLSQQLQGVPTSRFTPAQPQGPQAFNTLSQQLQGVPASRFTPAQPQGPQAFNTLSQQPQGVPASRFTPAQPQGPQVPINEDNRDGPFHDGSYYFGYVSGDGSVREEGAVPTADGSFIVTGSYTYTAPNGEVISMEYIADANGYRAFPKGSRADFTSPQRILNAPPLPNTPFVDEVRLDFSRPILNQRPQAFRPVGPLSNNLNNQVNRPNPQQILGANRLVGNIQNSAAASNNINIIAEPIPENNV